MLTREKRKKCDFSFFSYLFAQRGIYLPSSLRLKGFRDTFWNTPEGGRVRNDLPFCTRSLDFARDDRGERRDDRGAVFGTTCRSVQDPSTWSLRSLGRDDIKENAAIPMGRLLRALPCHFDREGLKARRVEKSCAQAYQ